MHPAIEPPAHGVQDIGHGRVVNQIACLVRIEHQVVELLGRGTSLAPAIAQPEILAGPVVAVGQNGPRSIVEATDVLVALSTNSALRLVGGVLGHLRKDLIIDRIYLASDEGHDRVPL